MIGCYATTDHWLRMPDLTKCITIQYLGPDLVLLDNAILGKERRALLQACYVGLTVRGLRIPYDLNAKAPDFIPPGLDWALKRRINVLNFVLTTAKTKQEGEEEEEEKEETRGGGEGEEKEEVITATHSVDVEEQSGLLTRILTKGMLKLAKVFLERCPAYPFNSSGKDDLKLHSDMAPLHIASQHGYLEIVQLLVERVPAVNLNVTSSTGLTPLHLAAGSNQLEVVKLLVDQVKRIDLNARTTGGGETALHCTASTHSSESEEAMSLLVESGANINAVSNSDMTPLDIARIHNRTRSISFLQNRDNALTGEGVRALRRARAGTI